MQLKQGRNSIKIGQKMAYIHTVKRPNPTQFGFQTADISSDCRHFKSTKIRTCLDRYI